MFEAEFEQIEILQDAQAHCLAFLVIHNTRLGPAFGGIRRWAYRTTDLGLRDALDLARAMTLKCALAGVPGGGGKVALIQRPELDRRAAYALIGQQVELLGGRYYTGPDVGTEASDLEEVARWTSYVAKPGPEGPGNLAEPTALGVFAGLEAVVRRLGRSSLDGVKVAVQGLGEVGWRVAELLRADGASLVVADLVQERALRAADAFGAQVVDSQAISSVACDVLVPCALGGVIDDAALTKLQARAIAGSANNVLASPRLGEALFAKGVLYAPDFAINAGALIHGAWFHLEGRVPDAARVRAIGATVEQCLARSAREQRPPEVIAETMAQERLNAAPPGRWLPARGSR